MVRWETPRICKRSARSTARSCAIWVSFPVGRPLRTAPIAWVVVAGVTACAICLLLSAKCPEKAICHPASPQAARTRSCNRTRSCKEMQEGTRLAEVRPDEVRSQPRMLLYPCIPRLRSTPDNVELLRVGHAKHDTARAEGSATRRDCPKHFPPVL